MGFSIGRFLGAVAGPLVGGLIGGPAGALIGAGVTSAFGPEPAAANAATVGRQTQAGPISTTVTPGSSLIVNAPSFAPSSIVPTPLGLLGPVARGAGQIATGFGLAKLFEGNGNGKSPISIILAKARAATGGAVTRNKIIDAAKACGLETAAATFGLDVREICLVVVKGRSRRRRGISAADIRRTKRTIGFASKIRKDLKALGK